MAEVEGKPKTPFYKKWWFWVIVAVVVIGAIGGGGEDTTTSTPASKPAATSAEAPPPAEPKELAPGEGSTMADAAYKAAAPVVGEQVMAVDLESEEKFLMDRFMAAADANPAWAMEGQQRGVDGDTRLIPYKFADGSTFTFIAVPKGGEGDGLKLKAIEIER